MKSEVMTSVIIVKPLHHLAPTNYKQNLSLKPPFWKLFKSSYSGRLADVYETRLGLNGCCGRIKKNYVECFCPFLFMDTQESLICSV